MAKIQISIDDALLEKVDICSDEMYMSRSGFLSYAAVQVVNQGLMIKAITDVSLAMRKIADNGEVDEESKQQLADFERLINMMTQGNFKK